MAADGGLKAGPGRWHDKAGWGQQQAEEGRGGGGGKRAMTCFALLITPFATILLSGYFMPFYPFVRLGIIITWVYWEAKQLAWHGCKRGEEGNDSYP